MDGEPRRDLPRGDAPGAHRLPPSARLEVVNSGHIGETISGSIARLSAMSLPMAPTS
jgi:hypothetical protein